MDRHLEFGWNGRDETATISSSKTYGYSMGAVVFSRRTILSVNGSEGENINLVNKGEESGKNCWQSIGSIRFF